jgi:ribosomal protein L16/L10AE
MDKIHRRILYKNKINKIPCNNNFIEEYYIVSNENKLINKYEIESARIVISNELRKLKMNRDKKRKKKFWILVNFQLPYTKKSSHSRMGKGKGLIDKYKNYITINSIIFRLENIPSSFMLKIFELIKHKLSFSISIYKNKEFVIGSTI